MNSIFLQLIQPLSLSGPVAISRHDFDEVREQDMRHNLIQLVYSRIQGCQGWDALEEIRRVLISGRRAVFVTHRDISSCAGEVMEILASYSQRVHRSLTRRVLILEKRPEYLMEPEKG